MIQTSGIRKIFEAQDEQLTRQQVFELAYQAGFKLASFNGMIFAMVARVNWVETPLRTSDFDVKF